MGVNYAVTEERISFIDRSAFLSFCCFTPSIFEWIHVQSSSPWWSFTSFSKIRSSHWLQPETLGPILGKGTLGNCGGNGGLFPKISGPRFLEKRLLCFWCLILMFKLQTQGSWPFFSANKPDFTFQFNHVYKSPLAWTRHSRHAGKQQCAGLRSTNGNLESIHHHISSSKAKDVIRGICSHVLWNFKNSLQPAWKPRVLCSKCFFHSQPVIISAVLNLFNQSVYGAWTKKLLNIHGSLRWNQCSNGPKLWIDPNQHFMVVVDVGIATKAR